jgi:predicted esterase
LSREFMRWKVLLPCLLLSYACVHETPRNTTPKYAIVTPTAYTPARKYPAMIALHGAGGYKEGMMARWVSGLLADSCVVAYVESTEPAPGGGFTWYAEIPRERAEIRSCYRDLIFRYSVDTTRVLVGGFSAGGMMALDIYLTQTVPAKGFVCLCPSMPNSFSRERVEAGVLRRERGFIIAGANDYLREPQLEMMAVFNETGFNCQFNTIPLLGHAMPANFPELLDAAVDSLLFADRASTVHRSG